MNRSTPSREGKGGGRQHQPTGPKERAQSARGQQVAREWIRTIAVAVALWFVIQAMIAKSFYISSGSMEGTLLPGDAVFVNRALYGARVPLTALQLPAIRDPRAGDIVVFRSPVSRPFAAKLGIEPDVDVVKRIIGVPGDTLEMRRDSVFRNGRHLPEPYARGGDPQPPFPPSVLEDILRWQRPHPIGVASDYVPSPHDWGPLVVPADGYFVMGDNRGQSVDSRYWGFLPRENIRGAMLIIYFSYNPASWRPLPFLTAIRWWRLLLRPQ